jgi:porphobilinogen deaminase
LKIRVAARGSKLSLAQVKVVTDYLNSQGIETQLVEVKTRADLFSTAPLHKLGKGVFEKEVNEVVLRGGADLAVHSMKDLSSEMANELEILAMPKREVPLDSLVGKYELERLEPGSKVGTGSIRRKNLLKFLRPDLNVVDIRGNVDTRLSKLNSRQYDALILAEAGLRRLGITASRFTLSPLDFTPEPNQGIIAIVGHKDNTRLREILKELNHKETMEEARAERAVVKLVGGGCHSPLGVLFKKEGSKLEGIATYSDGSKKVTVTHSDSGVPEVVGEALARKLLKEMKNEGIIP